MITKKGRKIRNQQAMILNRDRLIDEQKDRICKLESILSQIRVYSSINTYGTDGTVYLRKINELAKIKC